MTRYVKVFVRCISHLEFIQRTSLSSSNPQEHESILGSMDGIRNPLHRQQRVVAAVF